MSKTSTKKLGRIKPVPVFSVDSFDNGIAFGQHRYVSDSNLRATHRLKIMEDEEIIKLRTRYALYHGTPLQKLELRLMRLSRYGLLRHSVIYFGTTTDPFQPFEGKFDASMKFLELFRRYTPGLLVVQTRSPLVVIAMPVFRKLGVHAAVTIGIETNINEMAQRYTPNLPRVEERLKAARALRNFGVEVTLQVGPVLPYGDWKKDARPFAELLSDHGDYIYVQPLTDGSEQRERQVRTTALAKRLAEDRRFQWLRPDAHIPLTNELEKIAPQKLKEPVRSHLKTRQVSMFAA